MKNTVYFGVDPGRQGFITAFDGENFKFYEMPTHKVETGEILKSGKPKFKTEFHISGLRHLVHKISEDFRGSILKVAIEDVGGRGGWSATNNFNFGYVAGLQRMVFEMLGAEIVMVRAQKWQSLMRQSYQTIKKSSSTGKTMISDPKAMAELIVRTEFPDIDFRKSERARNFDDNKVDSFLICLYFFRVSKLS